MDSSFLQRFYGLKIESTAGIRPAKIKPAASTTAQSSNKNVANAMKSSAERILVVDDEKSIQEGLSKVLRAENYEVLLAETGKDAVQRYGTDRIDLLLLDLNVPGGNGWATLEWLARVNPLLPVVIITGRANQRELAEKSGADTLMQKPLDVALLLQTIRELLDEPLEIRAQRANRRTSSFRFIPCGEEFLRELLTQRFTVPYPAPERAWQPAGGD